MLTPYIDDLDALYQAITLKCAESRFPAYWPSGYLMYWKTWIRWFFVSTT